MRARPCACRRRAALVDRAFDALRAGGLGMITEKTIEYALSEEDD
jgi:hypothetical protein